MSAQTSHILKKYSPTKQSKKQSAKNRDSALTPSAALRLKKQTSPHSPSEGSFGWLDARHTFSFGEHYDPDHMGFRSLRLIKVSAEFDIKRNDFGITYPGKKDDLIRNEVIIKFDLEAKTTS